MVKTQSVTPVPVRYGKFSHRMIASTLDLGLVFLVCIPMIDYLMLWAFPPMDNQRIMAVFTDQTFAQDNAMIIRRLWNVLEEQQVIARMFLENFLQFFFIGIYTLPFWLRFSTTPGKMLFRMQIQNAVTLLPMSRRQSIIRFLSYLVSGLPFSLGFAWIVFNRRRRGFHDLIAGTVVVVRPRARRSAELVDLQVGEVTGHEHQGHEEPVAKLPRDPLD